MNSWRAILNVETEQRVLRAAHDQGMTLKAAAWDLVEHSEKRHSFIVFTRNKNWTEIILFVVRLKVIP